MERRNAWKDYTKKELKEMEKLCEDYRHFLDDGKTERNVSASLCALQSRQDTAIWQMLLKKVES